jgi:hypothetical protein
VSDDFLASFSVDGLGFQRPFADFSGADAEKMPVLGYNFNFPHVPFGTICNDQICLRHRWRRVFPW